MFDDKRRMDDLIIDYSCRIKDSIDKIEKDRKFVESVNIRSVKSEIPNCDID